MSEPSQPQVTQLLAKIGQGDEAAREKLWAAIYDELHALAQGQMAHEAPGRTLQTTALVHEAYLRLFVGEEVSFANRRHFFAAAAEAMRRILVDGARKRNRLKRSPRAAAAPNGDVAATDAAAYDGQDPHPNPLPGREREQAVSARRAIAVSAEQAAAEDRDGAEILDVDEGLKKLEAIDPQAAEVVKQHYFIGMSVDEIAEIQGVAPRTVDNWFRSARALLRGFLADGYA
jgi:RNA polymerase sigma factor (sigma-70 family)